MAAKIQYDVIIDLINNLYLFSLNKLASPMLVLIVLALMGLWASGAFTGPQKQRNSKKASLYSVKLSLPLNILNELCFDI